MTSRDFCYWLQGYFEINGNQPRPPEFADSLNSEQIKMIRNHLRMVFKHEIICRHYFGAQSDAREALKTDGET